VGQTVRRGQVLLHLESRQAERKLRQDLDLLARSQNALERLVLEHEAQSAADARDLESARLSRRRAAEEAQRVRALVALGAATPRDLEAAEDTAAKALADEGGAEARTGLSAARFYLSSIDAQLDLAQARAQVDLDRDLLSRLEVRSPYDGKIIQLSVSPGTPVLEDTALVVVVDQSTPILRFGVGESRVGRIAVGQDVAIYVGNTAYPGIIRSVDARATGGSETTNSTVAVTAGFTRAPAGLLPGVSARAEVRLGSSTGALTLPRGAFLTSGRGAWVYVLEANQAVRTAVELGIQNATHVEVTLGLAAGDRVIVSGYEEIMEYERVQVDPSGGKER
jgi:multidrug resistance efflux pump